MRKLGIIGGTSWSSTALYYEHINRGIAQRLGGLHSAKLVIESLDLGPFAEMELSGDWDGVAHEVQGEGVVGEMPLIAPDGSFDYVSGCPLDTPSGSMSGSYRMVDEDGGTFDVDIPKFALLAPVN